MQKPPRLPCKTSTKLLTWLHDVECCTDKYISEWYEIFHVSKADRNLMKVRYGDQLVGLTTFVNFWVCRDLPKAKKPDGNGTGGPSVAEPEDRLLMPEVDHTSRIKKAKFRGPLEDHDAWKKSCLSDSCEELP